MGYTPFEVAAKEACEETGLKVRPVRLLALFDKKKHGHPPQPWYVYKAFVQCEPEGGALIQDTPETMGRDGFGERNCQALSYRLTGRRRPSWRRCCGWLPIPVQQCFAADYGG